MKVASHSKVCRQGGANSRGKASACPHGQHCNWAWISCTQCQKSSPPHDDSNISQITHRETDHTTNINKLYFHLRRYYNVLQRCRRKLSVPLCFTTFLLDDPPRFLPQKSSRCRKQLKFPRSNILMLVCITFVHQTLTSVCVTYQQTSLI